MLSLSSRAFKAGVSSGFTFPLSLITPCQLPECRPTPGPTHTMIRLLGFLFLSCLHFSFASRIHGRSLGHPVQKRPASIHQSQENGQVVRLPMNRRPPRITTKATKARAGSRVANGHHPSHTTTSDVPTFTPLILNTTTYFEDSAYGIKSTWMMSSGPFY